ncbi:PIN domain nuclease [Streptomyces sp. NPDC018693]|uniref:PIN domain nuclease n=1 Tax=unclassified Streptomyces TaxID=2593676 RepID=UPI0037B1D8B9
MTAAHFLLDKSAFARWHIPAVAHVLDELDQRGLLAVTAVIEMEILHSARDRKEADELQKMLSGFDYLTCPDEVWDRAKQLHRAALDRGFHRALSIPDLVIAACAERHQVTVLHYDGDFDMIAKIAGHPSQWVVEPGSVP